MKGHKFRPGDRVGLRTECIVMVGYNPNEGDLPDPCYGKVIENRWDEDYKQWLVVVDVMNSEWTIHVVEKYVYHVD